MPLKECCFRPEYGYTASASERPIGPKFLRITDIQNGGVDWEKVPYVATPDQEARDYFLEAGDILIARIGATTGKAYLIQECPEAVFASYLIRVRTKPGLLPEFLNYCLQTFEYWQHIDSQKGGRLKGGVNIPILENLEIPFPSPIEQRAIVQVLDAARNGGETRQRELALERERMTFLMDYLFTHGTRGEPTKQTEIGEIPNSWKVVSLRDVARITSGGTPDRTRPEYWNGGIPWAKTGEVRYNTIHETDETISRAGLENSAAKIIPAGTLLMAMYGQGITRGKVAILGIDAALNQACAAILLSGGVVPSFIFFYLQFAYDQIRTLGHGANQKNLNAQLVGSIQIPLPPLEEQEQICDPLLAIDTKLTAIERERALLDELFKTLLAELMTGRLSEIPLIEEHQPQ